MDEALCARRVEEVTFAADARRTHWEAGLLRGMALQGSTLEITALSHTSPAAAAGARVGWRLARDMRLLLRVLALLRARGCYESALWALALQHAQQHCASGRGVAAPPGRRRRRRASSWDLRVFLCSVAGSGGGHRPARVTFFLVLGMFIMALSLVLFAL